MVSFAQTASARQNAIAASQIHLQLMTSLSPQFTLADTNRNEPDLTSDNLSGEGISDNTPTADVGTPVVDIDGGCDPLMGCKAKDAVHSNDTCPNGCFSEREQGFCDASGKCRCVSGWEGSDCGKAICPAKCTSHGTCVGPDTCVCHPGFNGAECDKIWTASFHNDETVTRTNSSTIRVARIAYSNYTTVANYPFRNLTGGITNLTNPPVVPNPTRPTHLRRRTVKNVNVPVEIPTTGSYFAVPALADFDLTASDAFTVSLWFRTSNSERPSKLLTHGNHRHGPGYGIGMLPGGYLYCGMGLDAETFRAQDLAVAVTQGQFADGRFHHVACRYDPKKRVINLLIDGNEEPLIQPFPYTGGKVTYTGELNFSDLPTPNPSAPDHPLVIGATYDYQAEYFEGEISEVRIWRSHRTYDNIRSGMWAPLSVLPPGLAFYLPLTDCSQQSVVGYRFKSKNNPQGLRIPNTLTDCKLLFHPLAKPLFEDEDVQLV
jgi:hypothetical protein